MTKIDAVHTPGGSFCRLRVHCLVKGTPEAVFDFHQNPRNLAVVMPPTTRIIGLVAADTAREGDIMELSMKEFGLVPMRWRCRWNTVSYPGLLVDEMIEGPFRLFIHRHRFDNVGHDMTRITDEVHYAFGSGPLGWFISTTAVRLYLHLIFAWRRRQTQRWFEAQAASQASVPSI